MAGQMSANLSSAMSLISSPEIGLTIAPLYGLIATVPSFSRARSASRTGERLTSDLCQFDLPKAVSGLEDLIENSFADLLDHNGRRFRAFF
jgi:hypothetical protein